MTRRAIGSILFACGAVLLMAGPWVALDGPLAWCLGGGIFLFALADIVAPFPGEVRRKRPRR